MKMNYILPIVHILLCEFFAIGLGYLPPEIQKCKSTDNDECIRATVQDIFKRYPTGNSELGMPNISALNVTNLKVSKSNSNSPVQINFEFLKCTIYGIEKAKILKASGFDKELQKAQIDVFIPNIKLKGVYEITGKLLLLPLNGKGIGEINLQNASLTFRSAQIDKETRDNTKNYFIVKKLKVQVEPKQMIVNLENAFNGSPVLSKTINDVINENWKDIWPELQDAINLAMQNIINNMINAVLKTLPVEEMYLD